MEGAAGREGEGEFGVLLLCIYLSVSFFRLEELAISDLCFPSLFRGGR